MSRNLKRAVFGIGALALPYFCFAAALPPGVMNGTEGTAPQATANCARQMAAQLRTGLAQSDYEAVTARPKWDLGAPVNYMLVTAHDARGRVVAQMVCRYDSTDHVVSLSPATAVERNNWVWK